MNLTEIRSAVEAIKGDYCFWGSYEKDIKILLSFAEQVLEAKWPEKKNCLVCDGKGTLDDWTGGEHYNIPCDSKECAINATIDACLLAHVADVAIMQEKIDILEKERDEWWSKAKCPDECYIPIKEHLAQKTRILEALSEEKILEVLQKEHYHIVNTKLSQAIRRLVEGAINQKEE